MSTDSFFKLARETKIQDWVNELELQTALKLKNSKHGDFKKWLKALEDIPEVKPSRIQLDQSAIQIGSENDLSEFDKKKLYAGLKALHPWRKGPFDFFGALIDAEWRSNLKWERVIKSIQPLQNRMVLDLGCGNGYYLWRMVGCGARLALGIDPSLHYWVQFQVFQKNVGQKNIAMLPLGVEDLPPRLSYFDTVFSMGLLYHRREPMEHLNQLFTLLREGGELVLETLVIDGTVGDVLKPGDRYAKMRNVWNIPTCKVAAAWLKQAGFKNIRCVDLTTTTTSEQRKTEWMQFESLEDFLDKSDSSKTVEGYPAPQRAVFVAEKP